MRGHRAMEEKVLGGLQRAHHCRLQYGRGVGQIGAQPPPSITNWETIKHLWQLGRANTPVSAYFNPSMHIKDTPLTLAASWIKSCSRPDVADGL